MKSSSKLPVHRHYRVLFELGSLSGLSDDELLARFLNRDDDAAELAFAALVERHARAIMLICRAIVRNEHDAEDAFQATFLVLASKAGRLRVRESFGPWLSAVARRISRGARAAALARTARELRAAQRSVPRPIRPGEEEDVSAIVLEEIDRLPERYRLPLLLCDLECRSHQEVAQRLGWPLGTVKSRQARARARLRARLSRRGLSSLLPLDWALPSLKSMISDSLIRSTSRTAVDLMTNAVEAEAVSASVKALVTHSLRSMIMTRFTVWGSVLMAISVGVAATVVAQTAPDPDNSPRSQTPSNTGVPIAAPTAGAPVYACEIRISKNGTPITPPVTMVAVPGESSKFETSAGTFEFRFDPRKVSSQALGSLVQQKLAEDRLAELARSAYAARLAQDMVGGGQNPADLAKYTRLGERPAAQAADVRLNAEILARILPEIAEASGERLARVQVDAKPTETGNHEKRLVEIERKLERILSVLEPSREKTSGSNGKTRESHPVAK